MAVGVAIIISTTHAFADRTVTLCKGESTTLKPNKEGVSYQWSNGSKEQSIVVTSDTEGTRRYTCGIYKVDPTLGENLMVNSSFESNPPTGFTSGYTYLNWDPTNMYYTDGLSGVYVITSDAHKACVNYYPITAQDGNYFALFDADAKGVNYAWRASTNENPNLKIVAGKKYYFSFWACSINTGNEQGNPAILQFEIIYTDANGNEVKQPLGNAITLKANDYTWRQVDGYFVAPVSCNNISISVNDLNTSSNHIGNDFALDNIVFQTVDETNLVLDEIELFDVITKNCDIPGKEYTICLGETATLTPDSIGDSYQWSTGETSQTIQITPDATGVTNVTCQIIKNTIVVKSNLISEGDFEFAPNNRVLSAVNEEGQNIKYEYQNFDTDGNDVGYGCTTTATNANNVKPSYFVNTPPHSGNYMLVVDGGNSSNARIWSARDLKLTAGETYRFSCWVANIDKEYTKHGSNSLPKLKFVIENADNPAYDLLQFTAPVVLGQWEYHEAYYTAPKNYSWCHIYVVNYTTTEEGNDFALDDIRFQSVKTEGEPMVYTQNFKVTAERCADCIDTIVYRKWNDLVFCDNHYDYYVSYQWFENGIKLEGETNQYLYKPESSMSGSTYHVEATKADGTVDRSCPTLFDKIPGSATSNKYKVQVRRNGRQITACQDGNRALFIRLFSTDGKQVYSICSTDSEIVLPEQPAGMYIIVIEGDSERLLNETLMLQ